MAWLNGRIYVTSANAANRRDVPYYSNTTGTVISGGVTGVLAWDSSGNRKARGRIDGSYFLYSDLEVLSSTSIRVYETTEDGDTTTRDVTVAAGGSYTTLIPGITVPLNGSLTTGHIARVYHGIFALDGNTFYNERGADGDSILLVYENPGTITHKLTEVKAGRSMWFDNTSGTPLLGINPVADAAGNYVAPADVYALTVANGTVSGKKLTFTGVSNTYEIDNVANSSTGNVLDGPGLFTVNVGTLANTDTATVVVSDYADGLEMAPDSAGSPGTWIPWSDATGISLAINRAGYTDQQVPTLQTVNFWMRFSGDITHPIGRGVALLIAVARQAEE